MRAIRICVLSAVIGWVLMLAGCGTPQENPYKEPMIINVYDSCSDFRGIQEGWYANLVREKFNIQLNFLDKTQEAMRKADLLICDRDLENPGDLMEKELLINIEPYMEEELPAISRLSDYQDGFKEWNEPFAKEGIYILPSKVSSFSELTPSEEKVPLYGFYINWTEYIDYIEKEEIFEENEIPEVQDHDKLIQILEQMTAADPGRAGISLCNDDSMDLLDHVSYVCGTMGYERNGFLMYRDEDRQYEELLEADGGLRKGVDWLRQAYKKGLILPDSFDFTYEEMQGYYEEGKGLLYLCPQVQIQGFEFLPLNELKIISHGCNPAGSIDTYMAVGAYTNHPERVIDFIGWLYSAEGIMVSAADTDLKSAGPYGLTWEVSEGNPVLTEFGKRALVEKVWDLKVSDEWGGGNWQEGNCKLNFQPVTSVEVSPSGYSYNYTLWDTTDMEYLSVSKSWQERMQVLNAMEYLIDNHKLAVIPGNHSLTAEDSLDIKEKRQSCRKVIVEYLEQLICAQRDSRYEFLWNQMRQELNKCGYADVVAYDQQ